MFGGHAYSDEGIEVGYNAFSEQILVAYQVLSGKDILSVGVSGEDLPSAGIQILDITTPFELTDNIDITANFAFMYNKNGEADYEVGLYNSDWMYMTGKKSYLFGLNSRIEGVWTPLESGSIQLDGEYVLVEGIAKNSSEKSVGHHVSALYNLSDEWSIGIRRSYTEQHFIYEMSDASQNTTMLDLMVAYKPYDNFSLITEYGKQKVKDETAAYSYKYDNQYVTKLTARYGF